jgi:hypothetical protein
MFHLLRSHSHLKVLHNAGLPGWRSGLDLNLRAPSILPECILRLIRQAMN